MFLYSCNNIHLTFWKWREREREKYKSIGCCCCCCFFSALCLDRETLAHTQVPFDMYVCANDKARVFVNKCMLLYRCSNVMWCDSFAIIMIAASFGFYFAWVLIWYALLCLASNTLRLQACTMYSLHFMLKSNQKVLNKIRMYKMCVFCRSNYLSIYLSTDVPIHNSADSHTHMLRERSWKCI